MARETFILHVMRTALLVANWKMHKTSAESAEFLKILLGHTFPKDRQVVVCPPFTALTTVQQQLLAVSGVQYGAQNMHWEMDGAYTGEVSPVMLTELGCQFVIVGHSERRRDFNETDESIQKKVNSALAHGLTPIICVGETLEQHQDMQTLQVVEAQLNIALAHVQDASRVVIAYEPVWAIGTGETATPEQAQTVHSMIRRHVSPETQIIYGGSVQPDTVKLLMQQEDIDGVLVGGASLDPNEFAAIVNY